MESIRTLNWKKKCQYNQQFGKEGGKAVIKPYSKHEDGSENPLILAICTPVMSRVHTAVQQASELVYVDSSSSLDDYNNVVFVLSTSNTAGGLPLGVVVTSGESSAIVEEAMVTLKYLVTNTRCIRRQRQRQRPTSYHYR